MTLRKLLLGFNLSLLLTLFLSVALPIWLLGSDAWIDNNTLIIGIMLLSFIAINLYFACNWTLFDCLEKGDWQGLRDLLYNKIFEGKNYKRKCVLYFIEVAIQLNDIELLRELCEELRSCESALLNSPAQKGRYFYRSYRLGIRARCRLCEYAIELGLPYLIDDPGHESEMYFGNLRDFRPFRERRYAHKYRWAELFYAISLLVQGKLKYAAYFLEQLLLRQPHTREDALLQLIAIQLLEDLPPYSPAQNNAELALDRQLIALRRKEIQKIYGSPRQWSAHLAKEQNQNIAITMVRRLIRSAYEQQLRPVHEKNGRKAHEQTGDPGSSRTAAVK